MHDAWADYTLTAGQLYRVLAVLRRTVDYRAQLEVAENILLCSPDAIQASMQVVKKSMGTHARRLQFMYSIDQSPPPPSPHHHHHRRHRHQCAFRR